MDCPDNRPVINSVIMALLFVGVLCILAFNNNEEAPLPWLKSKFQPSNQFNMTICKDDLDKTLAEASTDDKTLIIAMVNRAYVEGDEKSMLDLFLDGFWVGENTRGLTGHLLIVAMDQTSYDRCRFFRLHCYKLETAGVDFAGEKVFMSEDFIKMMWRRTRFLGDVIKRGYNFIFTDTDVLWLRNPFPMLSAKATLDLQISTDRFNGQQWSESNPINTGFYMVRSNNRTSALFDEWYNRKDNSSRLKEQDVLENLKFQGTFKKLGLTVRFLDTDHFSGFCTNSKNIRVVKTVHANCCRSISAKVKDLTTVIRDWKRFKMSAANETSLFRWSEHAGCINSWRH